MQEALNEAVAFATKAIFWAAAALNSNFTIAVIGGLVGAFGGAMGAQKIVEQNRYRNTIVADIQAINSAVMLSLAASNAALGLKKQIVGPLYHTFIEQRRRYTDFYDMHEAKALASKEFHFVADLTTFQMPTLPVETLRDLVLLKSSGHGKITILVTLIENAAIGLQASIVKREELIAHFKSGKIPDSDRHWHYFGLMAPNGRQNHEYADVIETIYSHTNDLIYFSITLCEALSAYGKSISSQSTWAKKHAPKIHEADFSGPRKSGLVPTDAQYSSFQGWINERGNTPNEQHDDF